MAAEAGGVGLVHSLLRSRLAWLTDAFAALDAESAELPRHALGAAELQIGPHLFAGTTFYRVGAAPAAEAPARCSQAQLAFEFGDNSGSLFWLPPDLGIEDPPGGDGHPVRAFFFATPRLPLADRRPRAIRREQPHYYIAQRTLVRVGIAMRGVERALAEALRDYARQPHATVWRDYRQAVCQSRPTAKYWFQFFPGQHQQALLKTVRLPPAGPGAKAPRARPERPAAQQTPTARPAPPPRTPPAPVVSGGGKGGYNVSVAAALLRKRRRLGQAPDVDSDADSDSGNSDSAPPDSPGADAASPARGRSCSACGCGETPIWRRGPAGAGTLCNACGVKWKLGKLQR